MLGDNLVKKIVMAALSCFIVISCCTSALAQGTIFESIQSVTMGKDQKEYTFQISVENSVSFAGAEFAALCGDGITVKSVSYSVNGGKAGPVVARGYTWFSFFSSKNDFSGKVTATITIEHSKPINTSIMIRSVSVYTKDGGGVKTEKLMPSKTIQIKKEGATNPIPPLNEPEEESSSNSGSTTNTNNSLSNNSSSQGTTSSASNEDTSYVSDNQQGSSQAESAVANSKTDKSTDNSTPKANGINTGLLIALIISVCVNVILVYLYISKNNNYNIKRREPNVKN